VFQKVCMQTLAASMGCSMAMFLTSVLVADRCDARRWQRIQRAFFDCTHINQSGET
jgi:hypothetical protein